MANCSTFNQTISPRRETVKPFALPSCVLVVRRLSSLALRADDIVFFANLNAIPVGAVPGDQSSLANGTPEIARNEPNSTN